MTHPRGIRWIRRALLGLGLATVLVSCTPFVAAVVLGAQWLDVGKGAPDHPADAIVVLNGDVDFHRTIHATTLWKRGVAPYLAMTGAGSAGDDAARMADAAIRAGAPPDAIVIEPTATSTIENLRAVGDIARARNWSSLLIVTSPFHTRRTRLLASRLLPDLETRVASAPGGPDVPFSALASEYAKLLIQSVLVW